MPATSARAGMIDAILDRFTPTLTGRPTMKTKKNPHSKKSEARHTELDNARHELHQERKSARAERQQKANLDRLARVKS